MLSIEGVYEVITVPSKLNYLTFKDTMIIAIIKYIGFIKYYKKAIGFIGIL
jgi:hypothetical protein